MPLFGLTPIEAGLDNADWSGSTHRGPCRVVAADERRARLFAANLFTDRKATRTPAGLLPASPWMRRGLVSAERVLGLADNLKADGTVLVPADSDDPGGAYRVFGTGRMVLSGPLQIRHANGHCQLELAPYSPAQFRASTAPASRHVATRVPLPAHDDCKNSFRQPPS